MQAHVGTTITDIGRGQFRIVKWYRIDSTETALTEAHDVLAESICYSLIAETLAEFDAGTMDAAVWH